MATEERKIQIPVVVDATGARAGFDDVKGAARDMAAGVAQEGQKAARSIATLGDGATGAAQKLSSAERNMVASIQRQTAALEAGERSGRKFYESLAAQRGVDVSVLKPYLDQLDAAKTKQDAATASLQAANPALKGVGVSAAQTANALRGVPAQFTDIIVSLQGGQSAMTVLLQQGGQLKDMFGGVVPAARALGGYVASLAGPFTLAAAAAVLLGTAYFKGAAESEAYTRTIIASGNAAGVTAGQLQDMAARIDGIVGTQSGAAAALVEFAKSGAVGAENIEKLSTAAIRFEKVGGQAVSETVKQFTELSKAPLEASLKLNESTNFLTASLYEQIKALEEQGKTTQAANLAQTAFADTIEQRAAQMANNLGLVERAWRGIKGAIAEAADASLNIGRAATPQQQIDALRGQLEQRESRNASVGIKGGQATEDLRNRISFLQEQVRLEQRVATSQAQQAEQVRAMGEFDKISDQFRTKRAKMEEEIAVARAKGVAAGKQEAEIAEVVANIRKKFAEKSTGAAGTGESEVARIRALIVEEKSYIDRLKERGVEAQKLTAGEKLVADIRAQLDTTMKGATRTQKEKALVAAEELVVTEKLRISEQQRIEGMKNARDETTRQIEAVDKSAASILQQAQSQEAANAVWGQGKTAIAENTLALLQQQLAQADSSDSFDPKYVAALQAKVDAQRRFAEALRASDFKQLNQGQQEYARQVQEESKLHQDELQLAGLTSLERATIVGKRKVELDLAKRIAEIDRSSLTDQQKAELRSAVESTAATARVNAAQKAMSDENERISQQLNQSLTDALLRGFESGKSFAQNFRDTVRNMFATLILRPTISAIMAPVSGAVSGALSGLTGGGGVGSALSWLTDFGGGASSMVGKAGNSLINLGLDELGGTLIDNAGTIGKALGTLGDGLGYLNSLLALKDGKFGQAAGAAIGTYFGGPIGAAIGSSIGKYIDKAFGGETRVGGQFAVAYSDQVVNNRRGQAYTYQGQQYDRDFSNGSRNALVNGQAYRLEGDPVSGGQDDAIRRAIAGTATGIGDMLKALGSKVTVSGFWAGLETSEKGRGGVFAGGSLSNGAGFGESGKGDNYQGTLYEKFSSNSPDFKAALENFTLDLKQSAIQALQSVEDIPESVKKRLAGVDAEALTNEAADALLTAINAQIVGVTQFKSALEAMGMDKFAALSFDAAAGIGELSGGFDKLQANLGTYYENFYSAEERRENVKTQLKGKLSAAGLDLPDIDADDARAQYRKLIDKQDPATEQGQKTIAMLLELAGAFASVTSAGEEAAKSATSRAEREKAATDKSFGYQQAIRRAQGLDREALDADRAQEYAAAAALGPEVAALAVHLWELQDAATAAAAAAEKAAKIGSVQDQIDELTGNSRAVVDRMRGVEYAAAAGNPELQALINRLWELQDAAAGAAKAAERAQKMGSIQDQIDELTGNSRAVIDRRRAAEYAAAAGDPEMQALINHLWELEDAASASAAATAAQAKAQQAYYDSMDSAYATLERSIAAQSSMVEAVQQTAQEAVSSLTGVFDTLKTNVAELYDQASATQGMSAQAGQAFIAQALSTARTTGYLPEGADLTAAITATRGGLDSKSYTSQLAYDRDRLYLAAQLAELQGYTGEQLSVAERQLKAAEDELKRMDDILRAEKTQLNTLKGIDTSVLTVTDAVNALRKAMFPEAKPTTPGRVSNPGGAVVGAGSDAASYVPGSPLGKQSNGSYVFSDGYVTRDIVGADAARLSGIDAIYGRFLNSGDVKGYYEAVRDAGFSLRDIAAHDGYYYGDVLKAAANAGVPAFERGTNYVPEHMLAVVHQGERIVPAADNQALMRALAEPTPPIVYSGGRASEPSELASALVGVAQTLGRIDANTRDTAIHTNASKRALERVIVKNRALVVQILAATATEVTPA